VDIDEDLETVTPVDPGDDVLDVANPEMMLDLLNALCRLVVDLTNRLDALGERIETPDWKQRR
jgi:chromatin remodeling complex protein RSC6